MEERAVEFYSSVYRSPQIYRVQLIFVTKTLSTRRLLSRHSFFFPPALHKITALKLPAAHGNERKKRDEERKKREEAE